MVRTQIYLTDRQRAELKKMARVSGKKQSDLIREAVDQLIHQTGNSRREKVIAEASGIWKDRTDLPDYDQTRAEWDRL